MKQHPIFRRTIMTSEMMYIKSNMLWSKEFLDIFGSIKQFECVYLPILHTPLKHIQSVFLNLIDHTPCALWFECNEPAVWIMIEHSLPSQKTETLRILVIIDNFIHHFHDFIPHVCHHKGKYKQVPILPTLIPLFGINDVW